MFKIKYTNEEIVNETGLAIVGNILNQTNFKVKINNPTLIKNSSTLLPNYDLITSYIGCLCQAKTEFTRVEEYRKNDFFKYALKIDKKVPSEEILRQRLDIIGIEDLEQFKKIYEKTNIELLNNKRVSFTPKYSEYINVDIDVSPHDNSNTKKEGVSYTYKKFDGYAPIYAYIGAEGYMLNQQLRSGSEHSQCEKTIPFLKQTISMAKQVTDQNLLFTLDSGHSCSDNIELFLNEKVDFIIKKNNGRCDLKYMFDQAQKKYNKDPNSCIKVECREGKEYYITSVYKTKYFSNMEKINIRMVQECIKRIIDKKGQVLLMPEYEIKQYYTSLDNSVSDEQVITLYRKHATSEQFHSELKTDMDLERFPSGKFKTNEIVLSLACLSFNILRMIGQANVKLESDNLKIQRKRLKTVIKDIMYFASKIVKHARQKYISISNKEFFKDTFTNLFEYFCTQ